MQQEQKQEQEQEQEQGRKPNARAVESSASAAPTSSALAAHASTAANTSTSRNRTRMTAGQMALAGLGFLVFGIGVIGIFVPLLPTTPLVMLAAFLLAKSSPRLHARILQTKTYCTYVLPFKEKGGMPRAAKIRALAISLGVLVRLDCPGHRRHRHLLHAHRTRPHAEKRTCENPGSCADES